MSHMQENERGIVEHEQLDCLNKIVDHLSLHNVNIEIRARINLYKNRP
ncbi:hypothetical protein LH47_01381 [Anoxybacillus thermarum]|uniref:Uncharacterized protein n=1 Tax=Anoxybacillus thermarum TaxID=404937 RepID=A0A0D0Q965_9BACL|nr:hypothetical protein LH47_01381 [Anoxybacillus thermarum]